MYKGAHEDEAAHKLETQSLARRCESRQETSDWLDTLPTVSIQRSKSETLSTEAKEEEGKMKKEEVKDDQEEQHLSMITTFHNDMADFRESLEEERKRDDELSTILKKEARCANDLKPMFVKTTSELVNVTTCRKSEMTALQSDWELQEQRRASLRSFVRGVRAWCSSARRENFNHFTFSCFNYIAQITRMSLVSLIHKRKKIT
jgi:hypothetical protein